MSWEPVTFGRWLRRFRTAEGLSQRQVAVKSDGLIKHASIYANLEGGKVEHPPVEHLVGIANAFGVEASYLLSKAGFLEGDENKSRVANFTTFERQGLARALGAYLARHPHADHGSTLADLLDELNDAGAADAVSGQIQNEFMAGQLANRATRS